MTSTEHFLMTLFMPSEQVCLSKNPYNTSVTDIEQALSIYNQFNYISINPLKISRADANVTSYRNILLEFDKGSIEEQIKFVNSSKVPYTAMTFSGNKSIHVIITLKTPLQSRAEYDALVDSLYARFPTVDKSCRNPSRFTRIPGSFREDTKKVQSCLKILDSVPIEALKDWIGPIEPVEYIPAKERKLSKTIAAGTDMFLNGEYTEGNWNNELFLAAIDLFRCGRDESEIVQLLRGVTGTLDRSDMRTIVSAKKAAQKE